MSRHLIVIGGGAAGFFCAVNAARINPALKVTVLEKSNKLLSKVKISGGGRCNVTHACFDIAAMSRQYPRGQHFVKKAFHRFFTTDTIRWFEERGVKLNTEADGRMFPVTNSAQTIVDCLLREADKYEVKILMNTEVKRISTQGSIFDMQCSGDKILDADFVCIASGGYPKLSMFEWLKDSGHTIEEPVPSLFTFNMPHHPITKLMGVSVDKVRIKIPGFKTEEEGAMLITHWGLSGPAVLRLSAWAARELSGVNWQFSILVNWLPGFNEQNLRERFLQIKTTNASHKITGKNFFGLPNRLWEFIASQAGVTDAMRWADLPAAVQNRFIRNLIAYECEIGGKTTFKEEFVTAGGIRLSEVDANTMMSKKKLNLFFAGEVLDVDGITGGFNFQHAWTSGFIAGQTIAAEALKH
jgi:predicted Rossmann fold flavoprotein